MLSTTFLFTDPEQISIVDKQKAELYMQIYQYAAEDFLTTADANSYSIRLTEYFVSVETQLTRIFAMLAKHTHQGAHGMTSPPITGFACTWSALLQPTLLFTSGVKPNLYNNYTVPGTAFEGAPTFGLRRSMPLQIINKTTLPPILTTTVKGLA